MKGWTADHVAGLAYDSTGNHAGQITAPALRTNRGNDGRQFQSEIETTCGAYHKRRVAVLRKVDPPVRIIWPFNPKTGKNEQRVIFQANPFNDYIGVWTARGGRALFIEAKSTSTHRLPFDGESGGFKRAQWNAMKTWRLAGAACCLLWKFGNRVVLFTPEMMLAAEATAAKSLQFENGIPVPAGEGMLIWDFLPTLERQLWPTP